MIKGPPITGSAALTLRDQLGYLLWDLLRRAPKMVAHILVITLVTNTVAVLLVFGPSHVPKMSRQDWEQFGQGAFVIFILISLTWPLVSFFIVTARWRKLAAGHRQITYEIDDAALTFRDLQGTASTLPWSSVKRACRTTRLLLLETNFGTWLYIPWRAIDLADQDKLWIDARARATLN